MVADSVDKAAWDIPTREKISNKERKPFEQWANDSATPRLLADAWQCGDTQIQWAWLAW